MSRPTPHVLICGAGPTGLTAAIELTRRGADVTIVEKTAAPSPYSRAVGVNARTLELLEACGATERLIEAGLKVERAVLFDHGRPFLDLNLTRIDHPRYPFILALPQNETEAILIERLSTFGVTPLFNHTLDAFAVENGRITAEIRAPDGPTTITADYLFGADGAHSTVRKALDIPFVGERYPETWQLYDVTLSSRPGPGQMNTFLGDGGAMLFTVQIGADRYRLMENIEGPDFGLPAGCAIVETHWESEFFLSHRLVERYADGPVFIGGDAAHIHPPAGGRGMNLGIEDAWIFARCVATGSLDTYAADRRAVGEAVVKQTDGFLRAMTLKNPILRLLRNAGGRTIGRIPAAQRQTLSNMSGLDPDRVLPECASAGTTRTP